MSLRQLRPESIVVTSGRPPHDPQAPMNTPIVLTSAYQYGPDTNHYARSTSTDTILSFEQAVGALDGGTALAFGSGMAAMAAIVEGLPVGTVAVIPRSGYSGVATIFDEQRRLGRMTLREVDLSDTDSVLAALEGADLLWLESPSNPLMEVADLPALISAGRAAGALVVVDSTFNTPLLFRPLDHGAHVVMHSATKYLAGHSDLLMGMLVSSEEEIGQRLRERRSMTGAIPGALECYLALRGVRTLALRMERAQQNAFELAGRLAAHPGVARVRFPGLPEDPFHKRASELYAGYGAMISFETVGDAEVAESVCQRVELIMHATSLGGVETLIERRGRHAIDARRGTPPTLLRMSVGVEHVEDLWADLTQALEPISRG